MNNTAEGLEETPLSIPVKQLTNNFTDPDGDTIELASVASLVGGSVNIVGSNVIFTPEKDFTYTALFRYTVKDSVSSPSANTVDTFTIKVKNVNDPPQLKPLDQVKNTLTVELPPNNLRITKSDLFNNFTDPDSTTGFTYKFSNMIGGKVLDETLTYIVFLFDEDFVGQASFDYTLIDSDGASATDNFKIKATQRSPAISIDSNGQTIGDNDQTPSVDNGTHWGQGTIGVPINHIYRIGNASDEDLKVTKAVSEEVDTGVVTELDIYKLLGIQQAYAAGASDFSFVGTLPLTIPRKNSANFSIEFKPTAVGVRTANITLSFNNGANYTFRVSGIGVAATASPPVVSKTIGSITVDANSPNTVLDLSGVFKEPDNKALTLSIVSNTNSSLVTPSLNGTNLNLVYAADQTGSATITIRATAADGETVETSFTVTVNSSTAIPIFSPFGLLAILVSLVWLGRRYKL